MRSLIEVYTLCELFVMENDPEALEWSIKALETNIENVSKWKFFVEYVFAVLVAGFKVATINQRWNRIRDALWGFNFVKIYMNSDLARKRLLRAFGNKRKADAIIKGAIRITDLDWDDFKKEIVKDINVLDDLPGIGPVSVYQIARNLGYDTIKPDRHIKRVADYFGLNPFEMCKTIAEATHQPAHYVDTVFWVAGSRGKLSEWL